VCVCLAGCSLTNKLVHRREPLLLLLRDATILLAIRTRGPFRNCQRARDVSVEGTQVGQSRTRQCGLVSRKQQLRALRLAGVGACMCACVPCVRACHVCVMCAVCVRGVCAHLVFCLVTCSRPAGSFKSLISAPAACACAARRTAFSIARCFSCSARCSSETHAHTQADAQYPRHAVSDSSRLSKSPRVPIVCMCPRVFPSLPVCVCVCEHVAAHTGHVDEQLLWLLLLVRPCLELRQWLRRIECCHCCGGRGSGRLCRSGRWRRNSPLLLVFGFALKGLFAHLSYKQTASHVIQTGGKRDIPAATNQSKRGGMCQQVLAHLSKLRQVLRERQHQLRRIRARSRRRLGHRQRERRATFRRFETEQQPALTQRVDR
jgi:hypothetical protein